MSEIKEIKDRMDVLEKNQAHDSKNIEGLHSRLSQIEAKLQKGKNELSETVKKEVNEAVSWEMEGVKREILVLFESRLIKLEQHLEDPFTALVGKVSKEDQPPSSSIHHKTMPPRREISQEETDHNHSPNLEQPLSPPKISGYQMKPK